MKRTLAWMLVLVLALVGTALPVAAQMGFGPHGGRGGPGGPDGGCGGGCPCCGGPGAFWRNPETVQTLGLSNEQVKSLQDLEYSFREQTVTLHAEMQKAMVQFERVFNTGTNNDQEVLKAAQKLNELHSQMQTLQVQNQLKVRKVLTAEQWQKLTALAPGGGYGLRGAGGPGGPGCGAGGPGCGHGGRR